MVLVQKYHESHYNTPYSLTAGAVGPPTMHASSPSTVAPPSCGMAHACCSMHASFGSACTQRHAHAFALDAQATAERKKKERAERLALEEQELRERLAPDG